MEEKGGKILMNNMRIEKYDFSFITHTLYRVFVNEGNEIQTLVTHNARVVELWIDKNIRVVNSLIVGLGVQWRPNFIRGEHRHPVATLQLSLGKYCLIFQILESGCCIPDRLREFLGDPRYTFVGVGVGYNVMMLSTDCGLRVAKIRELGPWAALELGRKGLGKAGLKTLVNEILGVGMEKPKNITLSMWDSPELSLHQVAYASRDAYFSFEIGFSLSASVSMQYFKNRHNKHIQRAQTSPHTFSVWARSGSLRRLKMEEKDGKILMNNMRIEKYNLPIITHTLYRVFVDEDAEIETFVTHNASVVELWIEKNIEEVNSLIVGLGVQWRPKSKSGEKYPVATLQLSLGKYCLIFQILKSGNCIPDRLREFLGDPKYTFVGVGVQNNVYMLRAYCGLKVANIMELNLWAAFKLDRMGLGKAGLKLLVKEILGVEMEKPKNIKFSLWDSPELSLDQVAYASRDAYFSFEIGRSLSAKN